MWPSMFILINTSLDVKCLEVGSTKPIHWHVTAIVCFMNGPYYSPLKNVKQFQITVLGTPFRQLFEFCCVSLHNSLNWIICLNSPNHIPALQIENLIEIPNF